MGSFLVVLSSFGFATLGIFGKIAFQSGFSRNHALFFRFLLALPLMAILLLWFRPKLQNRKALMISIALGAVGIGVEATLYFLTLERLGAALTGIFLYLYPAFVALISHFFLNEKLTFQKAACVGLALMGCMLTAGVVGGSRDGMPSPLHDPVGLIAGVLTGAWYALYILAANRLTSKESPLWVSSGVVAGSLIAFTALALIDVMSGVNRVGDTHSRSWLSIGGLALFATVLPFATLYAGLKRVGALKASLLSTLELVFTIVLARVFLDERLTLPQQAGALMILISVLLAARHG